MRAVRLTVASLLASSSLMLLAAPAGAASSMTPLRAGNDGVKAFTVSGAPSYVEKADEAVVLRAHPANGQADVVATVTDTGSCSGLTVPGLSQASCAGPLAFTADLTNVVTGSYDVVETRTDQTTFPAAARPPVTDGSVTVFAQPAFAASTPVAPASRGQNSVSQVTVKGTGFTAGVSADFGAGTTMSGLAVASPTQLSVTVTAAPDAPVGTRTVTLTSPDDGITAGTKATATLPAGFAITDAPTLTSVAPSSGTVGTKQGVTLTGTHFVSGDLTVTVPQVQVANVVVVNATTVTADLTPGVGAAAGPHSVFLTNPDGGRTSLTGGFTVIAPPNAPTGLTALAGEGQVYLGWAAPVVTGTGPVTGYRVTTSGGIAPVDVTGTQALITGLTNGITYTFSVTAKNAAAGYGAASLPVTATPKYAVTLTAHSGTVLTAGASTTVSGRLARTTGALPIAGATVALRYAPAIGSPVTRNVVTGANGAWTDSARAFTYTTVVTASYAGTGTVQAKSLALPTISVATKVTRTTPATGATTRSSSPLSVKGATSPNKAGHAVYLYRVLSSGHLQALTKAFVGPSGVFELKANLARGAYTLRIGVPAAAGNATGYSSLFLARRS
jgi:hypothetical protein